MDTLTHTLVGAALAKTRLGSAAPLAAVALVAAANLPDFENIVLAFCDHPTNLMHHRSVTHAVVGVVVLIPAFALLVWWLGRRWRQPARAAPARPHSFRLLLLGVALAVGSHPILDWLNTYGVRPWLPFDGTWYHGDIAFIADPWIWLLLIGATALAGRRTRGGTLVLAALGLTLTAVIFVTDRLVPRALLIAWPAVLVVLTVGRRRRWGSHHPHMVVSVAFMLMTAYLGGLYWAGRHAWWMSAPIVASQLPPGEIIVSHTLSPQPANPFRWEIVAETQTAVYRHGFSILEEPGGVVRLEKHADDPLVQRVADSAEGRAWRVFARHPVAVVARNGAGRRVYLLDARYPMFPPAGFASFAIDVPSEPRRHGPAVGSYRHADGGAGRTLANRALESVPMKTHGPLSLAVFNDFDFQENGYLLWPTGATTAWIIDPGFPPQPEKMIAALEQHKLEPAAILITHAHIDHIAGIEELRVTFPNVPIWVPRDEQHMLGDPVANVSAMIGMQVTAPAAERLIAPGDTLTLGALHWQALDVAGHSPGGIAYYCAAAGVVFTGDALFAGSIGRTDFPGSSARRLLDNIREHLFTLPDDTVVYSGHGPATTILDERAGNPFLQGDYPE